MQRTEKVQHLPLRCVSDVYSSMDKGKGKHSTSTLNNNVSPKPKGFQLANF